MSSLNTKENKQRVKEIREDILKQDIEEVKDEFDTQFNNKNYMTLILKKLSHA